MEHLSKIFYLILTIIQCTTLANSKQDPRFIVWNVGQGQWITAVHPKHCLHFDAGGDRRLYGDIKRYCSNKTNQLYISHLDNDHINQVGQLKWALPNICIAHRYNSTYKKKKHKQLLKIPLCKTKALAQKIYRPRMKNKKDSENSLSQVFYFNKLLISGDSETKQEKYWSRKLKRIQVDYFIIGHHGSKTSNSSVLLKRLKHLRLAIGSSRKSRYGHPSQVVTQRFRQKKTPMITTNNWGNIYIY